MRAIDPLVAFDIVSPHLPPELVCDRSIQRARSMITRLPPIWDIQVFECRFSENLSQVDFLLGSARHVRDPQSLIQQVTATTTQSLLMDNPKISGFLEKWALEDDWKRMPLLWLEADFPQDRMTLNTGACINDSHYKPHAKRPSLDSQMALCTLIYETVVGSKISDKLLAQFEKCAEALPTSWVIGYVAPLIMRGNTNLRMFLTLPHNSVANWLSEIGWSGNFSHAATLLDDIITHNQPILGIQIEISEEGVGSYLGIETYLTQDENLKPMAYEMLDRLKKSYGNLEKSRARTAVDWIGTDVTNSEGSKWPIQIDKSCIIKNILQENNRVETKGYLEYSVRQLSII